MTGWRLAGGMAAGLPRLLVRALAVACVVVSWSGARAADTLQPGQALFDRQALQSKNGAFAAVFKATPEQGERGGVRQPMWSTLTLFDEPAGHVPYWSIKPVLGGGSLAMQPDGDLVLLSRARKPLWASNTAGNPGAFLALLDDGNLVIVRPGGQVIWASNTARAVSAAPAFSCKSPENYASSRCDRRGAVYGAYMEVFGRGPTEAELRDWLAVPDGDPSLANKEALHAGLSRRLAADQAETWAVARRALHTAFDNYSRSAPDLHKFIEAEQGREMVAAAVQDLAQTGYSYGGLWRYLGQQSQTYVTRFNLMGPLFVDGQDIVNSYRIAFGRDPKPGEMQFWQGQGRYNTEQLVGLHRNYLKQDEASRRSIISRSYDEVLKRPPNPDELGYWNARIASSGETYTDLVNAHRQYFCNENSSALYAFDGTATVEEARSSIWQVYKRFQGIGNCQKFSKYIYGPDFGGSNQGAIFDELFNFACRQVRENNIQKVFVIGFSRGAINAMRFANEFPGCANGRVVTFIGAVDPVDALLMGYHDHKKLQPGRAGRSLKIYKSNNAYTMNPLHDNFVTTGAPGFAMNEPLNNREQSSDQPTEIRHWMMNANRCQSGQQVEARLMSELASLGVSFGPPPERGAEECKM